MPAQLGKSLVSVNILPSSYKLPHKLTLLESLQLFMNTFYWHDYETWGATPSIDRASQFAGVRTDENLNIISDPLVIYCRPPEDIWPQPMACLITGITPQHAQANGLSEQAFISRIHDELSRPKTCGVGYNTLRFDDEVTRYTLYRNFFDPYEREWKNGNSRWDIIDMVRLVYALRPDDIEWPMVDGKPSFKLENLTVANGISHQAAHDAYSDVEATINMARLIKEKKPAIYDYVLKYRNKRLVAELIDIERCKPLLHISSRFPATRGCAGLIAPLAMHPVNKNAVIVYDLSVDPSPLATLTPEQIRARVFVAQDDLPEGEERLPIKLVHLNKCPVLATTKLLDERAAKRHGIDKAMCEQHWQTLKGMRSSVGEKLSKMYMLDAFEASTDPESRLYDGFINDDDKQMCAKVRGMDADTLASTNIIFNDPRLNEMIVRYKARNFPSALTPQERSQWQEFVHERLRDGEKGMLSYTDLRTCIDELKAELMQEDAPNNADSHKLKVLSELENYAIEHMAKFGKI